MKDNLFDLAGRVAVLTAVEQSMKKFGHGSLQGVTLTVGFLGGVHPAHEERLEYLAQLVMLALTTVRQPIAHMAQRAFDAVAQRTDLITSVWARWHASPVHAKPRRPMAGPRDRCAPWPAHVPDRPAA